MPYRIDSLHHLLWINKNLVIFRHIFRKFNPTVQCGIAGQNYCRTRSYLVYFVVNIREQSTIPASYLLIGRSATIYHSENGYRSSTGILDSSALTTLKDAALEYQYGLVFDVSI